MIAPSTHPFSLLLARQSLRTIPESWKSSSPKCFNASPKRVFLPSKGSRMDDALMTRFDKVISPHLPEQKLLAFPGRSTLYECLAGMQARSIRCAVVNQNADVFEDPTVIPTAYTERPSTEEISSQFKLLDMKDVLNVFVQDSHLFENHPSWTSLENDNSDCSSPDVFMSEDESEPDGRVREAGEFMRQVRKVRAAKCATAANISSRNNYVACYEDDPFSKILKGFRVAHRVPICAYDPQCGQVKMKRVFTALELVKLLQKPDFLESIGSAGPASEAYSKVLQLPALECMSNFTAGICSRSLYTVSEKTPLWQTIRTLTEKRLTAIPVVSMNNEGKIVAVLSGRDLLNFFLSTETTGDKILEASTMSFIAHVRQKVVTKSRCPTITARCDETLLTVVNRMSAADVQRIFFVDKRGELVGVMSRTDLAHVFAHILELILPAD